MVRGLRIIWEIMILPTADNNASIQKGSMMTAATMAMGVSGEHVRPVVPWPFDRQDADHGSGAAPRD